MVCSRSIKWYMKGISLIGYIPSRNIKGVVSDIFNENTRYFKDILQIYIYYIDSWPDWNITGILQVY